MKAIVLDGAGKAFVAGADIRFFVKNMKAKRLDAIQSFTAAGQDLYKRIDNCPKPVVAKVDGVSLGGGTELALTADEIIVTDRGCFGFPETGIGIYPGLGGTQRTRERIGADLTKYLVFTGQILDGKSAVELGLADHFVERTEVAAKIGEIARSATVKKRRQRSVPERYDAIARFFRDNSADSIREGKADTKGNEKLAKPAKKVSSKAPIALRIAEELIDKGNEMSLDEGLALELSRLEEIFATEDAMTGLTSLGKGRPEFSGR